MNTLVFATSSVTPEQWADFTHTAGCPPDSTPQNVYNPYVLIYSPSQSNLKQTEQLNEPVESHFSSAKWNDIKSAFLAFIEQNPKGIMPVDFLVLDQQSFEDRSVLIFEKRREWPDGKEEVVWFKYRAPFADAWAVQCGIEGFCGLDLAESYFVGEVEREVPQHNHEDEE